MSKAARTQREQQLHELHTAQATMRRALANLAYAAISPGDVANKLAELKMFGANFSATLHPVVVFLAMTTGLEHIRLGSKVIHYRVDAMRLPTEDVPGVVWEFVAAFDAGRYPHLELTTQTESCLDGRCEYCMLSLLVCKCWPTPAGLMPI